MYKKSISLLLISTLSLSLSSCSIGVNPNVVTDSPTLASNPVTISITKPAEQAGPLSLGEAGLKLQQDSIAQEQILRLQKEVNFLQKQALYLQEQANLLHEASRMTVRIVKPVSAPDDPGITMEQRKAEAEKQLKEFARLAEEKQKAATKAFGELNLKQAEIMKLQGEINTIVQSGMKIQAEDNSSELNALNISINEISSKITRLQAEIADRQLKLQSAQTAAEKIKLTDEIKNKQTELLDSQYSLVEAQNKLSLEMENIPIFMHESMIKNQETKRDEIKKQLDDMVNFQNYLKKKYDIFNNSNWVNQKLILQNTQTDCEKKILETNTNIAQLQSWLDAAQKEKAALIVARDKAVKDGPNELLSIQNAINASSSELARLASERDKLHRFWNGSGYAFYSVLYSKELENYNNLVAQRDFITSPYNSISNYNLRIAEKDKYITDLKDKITSMKAWINELQAINKETKDYLEMYQGDINESVHKKYLMGTELEEIAKNIQLKNEEYNSYNNAISGLSMVWVRLMMESETNKAKRMIALYEKKREIEAQKQAAIKAAEDSMLDIQKQEDARLEAIRKAEEEKLAAEKKALEEAEKARKEQEAKDEELKKQQELLLKGGTDLIPGGNILNIAPSPTATLRFQPIKPVTTPTPTPVQTPVPAPSASLAGGLDLTPGNNILNIAPTPTPSPTPFSITILPESVNITQNNTASMRIFVKNGDGKYVTDDSVKIESLKPSIIKINKIEKGSIEFIIELGFTGAGEGQIKVSTAGGVSKTISVYTSASSSSSPLQVLTVTTPTTTSIGWNAIAGATSYKVYITDKLANTLLTDYPESVSAPDTNFTPPLCGPDNFSILDACVGLTQDKEYIVQVKAVNGSGEFLSSTPITIKTGP